jgi:hypothetical protein
VPASERACWPAKVRYPRASSGNLMPSPGQLRDVFGGSFAPDAPAELDRQAWMVTRPLFSNRLTGVMARILDVLAPMELSEGRWGIHAPPVVARSAGGFPPVPAPPGRRLGTIILLQRARRAGEGACHNHLAAYRAACPDPQPRSTTVWFRRRRARVSRDDGIGSFAPILDSHWVDHLASKRKLPTARPARKQPIVKISFTAHHPDSG